MDKVQARKDKQYADDFMLCASLVYYWRKQKPDNEDLVALSLSLSDMNKYVSGLQNELEILRKMVNGE